MKEHSEHWTVYFMIVIRAIGLILSIALVGLLLYIVFHFAVKYW